MFTVSIGNFFYSDKCLLMHLFLIFAQTNVYVANFVQIIVHS